MKVRSFEIKMLEEGKIMLVIKAKEAFMKLHLIKKSKD